MSIEKISSFQPGEIWPDTNGVPINAHGCGMLTHEGVVYWYGEHKIEGEAGNHAHVGVHVYSSRDLYNWKDEGIALAVSDDPQSPITKGCVLERPKVIFNARTKKFVMWFHLAIVGTGHAGAWSGVAVADHPTGPFHFRESFFPNAGVWPENAPEESRKPLSADELALVNSMHLPGGPRPYYPKQLLFRRDFETGQHARDMTLFVDDDATAYHVYSSEANGTLHISQLSDDYLKPAGKYVRVFPGRFHEAPALMKWRGRYYMITSDCTSWTPNTARLAVAGHIFGPWEELGSPCIARGEALVNTFNSQSCYILPVPGKADAFIFLADRWNPKNAIDGRYVWLPIEFRHGVPTISWHDRWDLSVFDRPGAR